MTPLVHDRYAVLALGLTAVVFAVDLSLPLGVAAAVPYTFAVLLALRSRRGWFALLIAGLCWILTIAKMGIVPERGNTEMWKVVVNRCLALFAIGMTTFLGLRRRKAEAERADAEERVREHLADLARMGRLSTAAQLATGLAHELNQPLAAVCLQAEIAGRLADRGATTADLLPPLREIEEQSRRAAEIVRALRRMIGRGNATHAPVAMADVLRTVTRLLDGQARRCGVEVRLDIRPVAAVSGDRVQLEQVAFNLVQNAIEAAYTAQGRKVVTICLAADGTDRVTVTVRDTGPGLPADDPGRVFERFYTTKPNGMGMGLAISRSIVEAHGGRLGAAPAADGGAVFTFSLPAIPG